MSYMQYVVHILLKLSIIPFYWTLSGNWKLLYWETAEYGASGLVICALEILSLTGGGLV